MRTTKRPRRESNRRLAAQPQGVYGTRTAQRIRAARQRRAAQSLMALIVGLLLLAMLAWRWQSRRTAPRAPSWSYALAASPSAEPFLENDQLFIPTQNGALIAFAMQQKTARSFSVSDFALTTQPLVRGEAAFVGGADGVLRAVNWKTGKIAWSVRTAATISTRPALLTHSALTAHSLSTQQTALLVVGNDAGEIVGCAAGNGRVLWRYQAGAPIGNAILAASVNGEERIFVPLLAGKQTRGGVLCLSSEGKKMWERDLGAARVAPLVVLPVSTRTLALYSAGDDGSLIRLNAANGSKLQDAAWKNGKIFIAPIPENAEERVVLRAAPLLYHDERGTQLFVGGNDGALRCYDAETAKLKWTQRADVPLRFSPLFLRLDVRGQPLRNAAEVAAHELVLLGGESQHAMALESRTGEIARRWQGVGNSIGAPLIYGSEVVRVTREGEVQGFSIS